MSASNVMVQSTTTKFCIEALKGEVAAALRWRKATDALRADGVTSALIDSKTGDIDLINYIKKEIVLASFSAGDLSLMSKDIKTLNAAQKTARQIAQQQIGSKMGKIRTHLKASEAKDAAHEAPEAPEAKEPKSASLKSRLDKDLSTWIVRLEKCESSDFASLADVVKALKIAQVVCNK